MSRNFIEPPSWDKHWPKDRVAFLKPLILDLKMAFAEIEFEICFYLVNRTGDKAYISMGARPEGKQPNGNPHSFLCAFGFFYVDALRWPPGYPDYVAERAATRYQEFQRGEFPFPSIYDHEMIDRLERTTEEEDCLS